MLDTIATRPRRTTSRPARQPVRSDAPVRSTPAPVTPISSPRVIVIHVIDHIHRVEVDRRTVGYIARAGKVYVALEGSVYNTSVEVAQSLRLTDALEALTR